MYYLSIVFRIVLTGNIWNLHHRSVFVCFSPLPGCSIWKILNGKSRVMSFFIWREIGVVIGLKLRGLFMRIFSNVMKSRNVDVILRFIGLGNCLWLIGLCHIGKICIFKESLCGFGFKLFAVMKMISIELAYQCLIVSIVVFLLLTRIGLTK